MINLAFGTADEASSIFAAGGIPKLLRLMTSNDNRIAKYSAWVLANLCGESENFCHAILSFGAVKVLVEQLMVPSINLKFLRTLAWFALNIARTETAGYTSIGPLFQPMIELLTHEDRKIVIDACWFFTSYVNKGCSLSATLLLTMTRSFCPLLDRENIFVVEATLHFIYAVSSRRLSVWGDLLFQSGINPKLVKLITHPTSVISRLSTLSCRNLASCPYGIQLMLEQNILNQLNCLLAGESFSSNAMIEGIQLMRKILIRGSPEQATEIAMHNALLLATCNLLKSSNFETIKETLKLVEVVFDLPAKTDVDFYELRDRLAECGLDNNLENLLDHVDGQIHEKVFNFMQEVYPNKVKFDFYVFSQWNTSRVGFSFLTSLDLLECPKNDSQASLQVVNEPFCWNVASINQFELASQNSVQSLNICGSKLFLPSPWHCTDQLVIQSLKHKIQKLCF